MSADNVHQQQARLNESALRIFIDDDKTGNRKRKFVPIVPEARLADKPVRTCARTTVFTRRALNIGGAIVYRTDLCSDLAKHALLRLSVERHLSP